MVELSAVSIQCISFWVWAFSKYAHYHNIQYTEIELDKFCIQSITLQIIFNNSALYAGWTEWIQTPPPSWAYVRVQFTVFCHVSADAIARPKSMERTFSTNQNVRACASILDKNGSMIRNHGNEENNVNFLSLTLLIINNNDINIGRENSSVAKRSSSLSLLACSFWFYLILSYRMQWKSKCRFTSSIHCPLLRVVQKTDQVKLPSQL